MSRSTAATSVTSTARNATAAAVPPSSSAIAAPPASFTSARRSFAPSRRNRRAVAAPMPDAAPVMTVTFPSRRPDMGILRSRVERVEIQLAHLRDARVERRRGPSVRRDRRMHDGFDARRPDDETMLRKRVERVPEDDRHDRDARGHRQMERALLELAEAGRRAPRPFGRDHERGPFAEHRDRRAERLDRLLAVRPVDEDGARECERGTEDRVLPRLLLRDADEVAAEELAEEQHVDRALVVEDEHGRTVRPDVLLPVDGELDAGEKRRHLAPGRHREVHHVAPASGEEPGDYTERERRYDARDRRRRADHLRDARRAATREAADRPAAPRGDRREAPIRVRRPRPADRFEQREVLVAVGVEEALPELAALLARERARRERLAAAVARRPEVASGEASVLDLEPRAEDVRDLELARERLDLVAGRRRDERERVPAAAVRLHDGARLGVDRRRDRLREDALGELLELALRHVAEPGGGRGDEPRES